MPSTHAARNINRHSKSRRKSHPEHKLLCAGLRFQILRITIHTMSALLQVRQLHRSYRIGGRSLPILQGLDLDIAAGEVVFLCGPSGAGKTTLLYTMAGLETPQSGQVWIDGKDIYSMPRGEQARFRNRYLGYVFQNYHLLPELTALENVCVPSSIAGHADLTKAHTALERVGLAQRAHHLPTELSGGEQQRVAIARAVAHRPRILFADEPTGNLDSRNSHDIMTMLLAMAREHDMTVVIVTHDRQLTSLGDRTLLLQDGQILSELQPS